MLQRAARKVQTGGGIKLTDMKTEDLKKLLVSMSLQEKADQMLQLMGTFYLEDTESVLTGPAKELGVSKEDICQAGSIFGTAGAKELIQIQKNYMENQPHHIPMLFMMDVIHGMRTIFPIPLAQGAAFEPELSERCAAVTAREASVTGLHATFAPMVDLVRDARWGRVMESTGEDPYLNSLYAAAVVKGLQGENMGEPYKICACIKHFAAYGAPVAGREYNTVELSEHTLREFYFTAYKAGIDAGAGMVMTAFNTINGIPATVNKWLMKDVLRKEMGFEGVLISDFSAIQETISHGYSPDEEEAAKKAIDAGVDIDMMSSVYSAHLRRLVQEGKVKESQIDDSVMRILQLKNKMGLFENPCKDADPEQEEKLLLCREHRELAREAAGKSFVLLKNDGILPVDTRKKIAFIGPYSDNKELLSSWAFSGDRKDCITIREAAEEVFDKSRITFCQGCSMLESTAAAKDMMQEAVEAARSANVVVMCVGEHFMQSGEAASRAEITIPEVQMTLFREIAGVNENIIVVLFNGRPLDIREISHTARAVLEVWLPGTEGGHAIIDTLTGKVNPSGKLPMSFPYCVGQVPVHYNEYSTGRPNLSGLQERFRSKYIDIPNEPLYSFGYGLSYTEFEISSIELNNNIVRKETPVIAKVTVRNVGKRKGTQVIQMYIRDITASVVRPVRELKGFQKTELNPGEAKEIEFIIEESMLRFVRADGTMGSEAGDFLLWIGDSSSTENMVRFTFRI